MNFSGRKLAKTIGIYQQKLIFRNASNEDYHKVYFSHEFSSQEVETILEKLNQCDTHEQLSRFSVTSARAKKILLHRRKHGDFSSLDDVLVVEGFGVNVLKRLCNSILSPPKLTDDLPVRKAKNFNFVTPEIGLERIQEIQTVVGVTLGTLSVNWAGIDVARNEVFSWDQHVLPLSPEVKRHHETQILEAAYSAAELIPEADAYVMESCVTSGVTSQTANMPINQQRLQLSSMLLVLINQAKNNPQRDYVFFQRSGLWCRLYGTLVGSERVSTHTIVEEMMADAPGPYTPLVIPSHLVDSHYAGTPVVREALGSALLLTTCFLDVNLRRKAECFSVLRGRAKK